MSGFVCKVWTLVGVLLLVASVSPLTVQAQAPAPPNPQSGAVGLQATISAPPPSKGATISIPGNGQIFTSTPITVSGLCSGDVNVRIFRNEVFAGSVQCKNGSYQLQIDLFSGQNDIVARVYDSLDQAGPDSNKVTVIFNDSSGPGAGSRISLTSAFAKRGANPGDALTWPVEVSGGTPPYAMSMDWGDGKPAELKSQAVPGPVALSHVYENAGLYNIIIKATDKDGISAFLQVVGIAYGKPSGDQAATGGQGGSAARASLPYIVATAGILAPMILISFWLGRHYELTAIRRKLSSLDGNR